MPLQIGKNRNTNDESNTSNFSLNVSTATKIKDAGGDFIFFSVTNFSNREIWIKLQPAATDNLPNGIEVPRNGGYWEMPADNVYIGEISAISDSGNGKNISVVTY